MYPRAGEKWKIIPYAIGMIGQQTVTVVEVHPLDGWVNYIYDDPESAGLTTYGHVYQRRFRSFMANAKKVG